MPELLLPLIALVIAGLAIVALWLWWNSSDSESEETAEPVQPIVEAQTAPSTPEQPMTAEEVIDPPEVLRVLRDPADSSLIVVVNGREYRSIDQITNSGQRDSLITQIRALTEFARIAPAPATEPAWSPASTTREAARPPAPASSGTVLSRFGAQRRGSGEATDAKNAPVAPPTMAEEIEEILQNRLARTPEMATRNIHIHELAGGVQIEVDEQFYESVDDVADPEIRALIQAAIREWETRSLLH